MKQKHTRTINKLIILFNQSVLKSSEVDLSSYTDEHTVILFQVSSLNFKTLNLTLAVLS